MRIHLVGTPSASFGYYADPHEAARVAAEHPGAEVHPIFVGDVSDEVFSLRWQRGWLELAFLNASMAMEEGARERFDEEYRANGMCRIALLINGKPAPFSAVIARFESAFDHCVEQAARRLLEDRLGEIEEKLGVLRDAVREKMDELFPPA